jgi:hypothetical protein
VSRSIVLLPLPGAPVDFLFFPDPLLVAVPAGVLDFPGLLDAVLEGDLLAGRAAGVVGVGMRAPEEAEDPLAEADEAGDTEVDIAEEPGEKQK